MLIGGDDISDNLSRVFHCAHLRLFPFCADWQTARSMGSNRGIGGTI